MMINLRKYSWPLCLYTLTMLLIYISYAVSQSLLDFAPAFIGVTPMERSMKLMLYTNFWTGIGFLSLAGLRYLAFPKAPPHRLNYALGLVSLLSLPGIYAGGTFFMAFLALFMLTGGAFGAAAHYHTARSVPAELRGRFVAVALTFTVLIQYGLTSLFGTPSPWLISLIVSVTVLIARQNIPSGRETATPVCSEREPAPSPIFIGLLILLTFLLALLHGASDSLAVAYYMEFDESLFSAVPRLFFPLGVLAAGYLADLQRRKFLLPVTALTMLFRLINIFYFAHEGNIFFNLCFDYFVESFCLICYIVYFLDLAIRTDKPVLWAGMGRAIALPVTALSANLFGAIIHDFSMGSFLAFYILCLGSLNILFYNERFRERLEILPWETAPLSGSVETAAIPLRVTITDTHGQHLAEYQERYAFTPREMDVLAEILQETPTAVMAEKLGVKERTIKYHIANILHKTGTQNQPELRLLLRMQSCKQ